MWLNRGTIVQAKNEEDLAKVFDRMAAAVLMWSFSRQLMLVILFIPVKLPPNKTL
jgi:hypothetical protein